MTSIDSLSGPASLGDDPVVLYFHHVGRPLGHYTSISEAEFGLALDLIEEVGEVVLPNDRSSAAGFAITFDDGYRETLEVALPILEARGMRSALFVNSATVGGRVQHAATGRSSPACSWSDLAEAAARGHLVGSHGHTHADWSRLTPSELAVEISASSASLEQNLGREPFAFAYPFGRPPQFTPSGLEKYDCYATIRASATHRSCGRQAIRRVYLPAREVSRWRPLLRHWNLQRGHRCFSCGRDTRSVA